MTCYDMIVYVSVCVWRLATVDVWFPPVRALQQEQAKLWCFDGGIWNCFLQGRTPARRHTWTMSSYYTYSRCKSYTIHCNQQKVFPSLHTSLETPTERFILCDRIVWTWYDETVGFWNKLKIMSNKTICCSNWWW